MKAKGVIYILAAAILAAFAIANWALLMQPVEMNFLLARVQAPLAVLLLLLVGIVLLVDFSAHALREHAWMRDRRALVRDLEIARLRAEQDSGARASAAASGIQSELGVIRSQLDRVLAGQSALASQTRVVETERPVHSPSTIEPELIPPRGPPGRGVH